MLAPLVMNIDWDWKNFKFLYSEGGASISYRFSDKIFYPVFVGYITGNEIVVEVCKLFAVKQDKKILPIEDDDQEKIELIRVPLNVEPDFTVLEEKLTNFYFENIEKIM
ncbi:MAG: hypothetical protein AAGJ08_09790 [Cyanobacteria bacterium P01_H01_bin.35]